MKEHKGWKADAPAAIAPKSGDLLIPCARILSGHPA